MIKFLEKLLRKMRDQVLIGRAIFLTLSYSFCFCVSLWVAHLLRFDFVIPAAFQKEMLADLPMVLILKLTLMYVFGQYGVLLSYFRLPDLYRIIGALTLASLILVGAWYALPELSVPPRSILLADYVLSIFFVAGFRTSLRVLRERGRPGSRALPRQKRVAIIGAGITGAAGGD